MVVEVDTDNEMNTFRFGVKDIVERLTKQYMLHGKDTAGWRGDG